MTAPTIEVGVALGVPEPTDFIVGDGTRGIIGGTTYVLASGYTTITGDSHAVSITRGRWSRLWDAVDAGNATINVFNNDRDYDPSHLTSPYNGYVVPGRLARVVCNDIAVWTGFVEDWDLEYQVSGMSTASIRTTDALGMFGQLQFDDWTSSNTAAHTKLNDVCDRPEVNWSSLLRDFDDGVEALQSDVVSWGSNVLNYVQLIARSELGYLFASSDGKLTFRNRTVAGGVSVASFGDDGVGIPFQGIAATIGSELLFSRVGVDREGGTNQSATVADTATWQDRYGPLRSLSLSGLLLNSDAQSEDLAEYLLSLYDTPRYRVSELRVDLSPLDSATQDTVLAIDVTDKIDVTFTPNGFGEAIVQNLLVQGIRHDMSPMRHIVTFSTIEAPFPYFRIGDAEYGVIGEDIIGF